MLALFGDWADEVQLVSDVMSLFDLARSPLRSAPVESPAFLDYIVEGTDNFLDGNIFVAAVSKDNVDVVHLETFEGLLSALDNAGGR